MGSFGSLEGRQAPIGTGVASATAFRRHAPGHVAGKGGATCVISGSIGVVDGDKVFGAYAAEPVDGYQTKSEEVWWLELAAGVGGAVGERGKGEKAGRGEGGKGERGKG